MFRQVRAALLNKFPHITVEGSNYPPSKLSQTVALVIFALQITVISVTLFGEHLFPILGVVPHPLLVRLQANKLNVCMVAWFLGNTISGSLSNSGAFEIAYDGHLVFSKLNSQRLPSLEEIFYTINQIQQSNSY
jgi:selT/selW/selH-like putative selenoprotein